MNWSRVSDTAQYPAPLGAKVFFQPIRSACLRRPSHFGLCNGFPPSPLDRQPVDVITVKTAVGIRHWDWNQTLSGATSTSASSPPS